MTRFAAHRIERARFGSQRKTLPFVTSRTAAKSKLAGSPQREPEDLVEMRLVAVPADADPDIVFGAKDLVHTSRRQTAKCLDGAGDRCQPARNGIGFLNSALERVVVAETE